MMSNDLTWLDTASKLPPYGLPRNGLVALYDPYRDTYGRNILPVGSENFVTGWAANSSETITVTDYPTTINGQAVVAKRIQGAGNGGAIKKYYCVADGRPNPHLDTISVYVQKLNTTNCFMRHTGINPVTISATMQRLSISVTQNATYTALDFLTQNIADSLDILVYQPQINIGTLYPYSPSAGLPQSAIDYTGHANNAQLGSTAGADTNDPAYSGQGLVFGADDYCKSSSPAFDDLGAFTVIAVIDTTNGTDERHFWDKQITIGINSISNRLSIYSQCTSSFFVSNGTTTANVGKHIVSAGFKSKSDFLGFGWVDSIKQTFSIAAGTPAGQKLSDVANDLIIGNATALNNQIGNIYIYAVYNRALTDAEYMQAYNYLRRLMQSRGITI